MAAVTKRATEIRKPSGKNKRPIKTALHQAVLDGRLHQVRLLVFNHGANVDFRDLNGRTPLMLACLLCTEELGIRITKILLQADAYLNIKDHLGRTALSYACMSGKEEIVEALLKEDVLDVMEEDNDGNTSLHHAAMSANPNVVEMLCKRIVKFGLHIDARNALGYTPLLLACKMAHYVSAYIFISIGKASPSLRDSEFFCNASEWIRRSKKSLKKASFLRPEPRVFSAPEAGGIMLSRQNTIYQKAVTPICKHTKPKPDPFTATTLGLTRLPVLFDTDGSIFKREAFRNGQEAVGMLVDAIHDAVEQAPSAGRSRHARIQHPTSAKLRAFVWRTNTTSVPDMRAMFRVYSEQYGYGLQLRALFDERLRSAVCSLREQNNSSIFRSEAASPEVADNTLPPIQVAAT